jgi:3',5'-cyclic-AMP phosphodiesterase
MKFIHVTDLHLTPAGEALYGMDTCRRFEACLDDIAMYHGDAELCVITGDLTENGDAATYEWLQARLRRFPLHTRLLLGNCDNRVNFLSVFQGADANGLVQSTLKQEADLLVFMDTLGDTTSAEGRYDAERLGWLDEQLSGLAGATATLFMHHPPFDIGHRNDAIKLADHVAFAKLLEAHAVRHIFFGHTHRPVSGVWRNIGFTGLPGLNFQIPLVSGSVTTELSEEPPMYGVVQLEPDKTTVNFDAFLHRKPLGR